CEGLLPPEVRVVGIARSPLSDEDFHRRLFQGVEAYARYHPGLCERWPLFEGRISYLAGSYDDPETYRRLAERLSEIDADAG
ncbi:MAG: glucose-6-phosphate dehydrogenase, partial [Pseudomonas stutzeri]|nr:glucose-6-phosphate dehydrogenase [Stutzerimonas stutzeri]